jgi:hypothetical protein
VTLHIAVALTVGGAIGAAVAQGRVPPPQESDWSITSAPSSIRAEHVAILQDLESAMRAPGRTGAAARALSRVLRPHFVREEVIALPPLGALTTLAAGRIPPDADTLLAMSNSLRRELSQLLDEHARIGDAVDDLWAAARTEHAAEAEQLANRLSLHAQTEEDVLYPAAILAGEVIALRRARLAD